MPFKTVSAVAQLFVQHKDVSVYHTYEDDNINDGIKEYYYVLDESLNVDESFDVRDLKNWEPVPPVVLSKRHSEEFTYSKHQLKHIKKIIIAAIDSGELQPYKPA